MADLLRRIEAEEESVKKVLTCLDDVMGRDEFSIIELAAAATFIHNIYNGVENILKQTLKEEGITIPATGNWHKELLNKAAAKGLIRKELSGELMEYLAFRHLFVHGYGFLLKEEPIRELGTKIPTIWAEYVKEIKAYAENKSKMLREKPAKYSAKRKKPGKKPRL
jgi:uncharacterized protein YutE (UPF0331/DUF86 family)